MRLTLASALVVIAAAFVASAAPAASAAPPARYSLPGGAVFPEGIAVRPGTRTFFVSSTNGGAIYRGTADRPRTRVFLAGGADGRTAAVGMKADRRGRLYVAGGATGRLYVYDTTTRRLVRAFDTNLRAPDSFVNDVTLAPNGDAFFTDSRRPVIYRVSAAQAASPTAEVTQPEVWLDLTASPVRYGMGNNLNGIATAAGGRYLIAVQSNTGGLFRIDLAARAVTPIAVAGGGPFTNGDGLLVVGRSLYVVRNMQERIVKLRMSPDFSSGRVESDTTSGLFRFPTTIAPIAGRLLVVNSQFDARNAMRPPRLPFTVAGVRRP